jgi:hypothetical protein
LTFLRKKKIYYKKGVIFKRNILGITETKFKQ